MKADERIPRQVRLGESPYTSALFIQVEAYNVIGCPQCTSCHFALSPVGIHKFALLSILSLVKPNSGVNNSSS